MRCMRKERVERKGGRRIEVGEEKGRERGGSGKGRKVKNKEKRRGSREGRRKDPFRVECLCHMFMVK